MIDWLIVERSALPWPQRVLAPAELERYTALRTEKRRLDWLLGRWTAKQLVQQHLRQHGVDLPPEAIMVLSDPDGAPRIMPWGVALAIPHLSAALEALQISISHTEGRALCALMTSTSAATCHAHAPNALGADIEQIAARGAGFAEAYYTAEEITLLATTPADQYDTLATAIWSAKEATLKLTRHGLRVDTRAVTCLPTSHRPDDWAPISISTTLTTKMITGWWRRIDSSVITIAASAEEVEQPSQTQVWDWSELGKSLALLDRPLFTL
ncbi:MAG: 4'-phosphopantetheinyl transferase superfamily protein [Oscillochloris sp.]|nr:4'-phosphopantetheinyl transferase superfamily protein [Oscillochloris sp.]